MHVALLVMTTVATMASAQQSAGAGSQQSVTLNVPGTPEHAPSILTGCLIPAGGTTNMPGSGGSSGTGPAGMNTDAANTGVFFTLGLGKKHKKTADTSYNLVGMDAADMKRYANSRVEVEGVLVPPPEPGADKTIAVATGKAKKGSTPPSQFRVTAIKQIPGSCGGQ